MYIYYFKSLKPILLNPFDKNKDIGNLDSEEEITIVSANTLTKDDSEFVTQATFNEIDNSVNLWIQEKRYYLRLFASTLAFFIMYFFLSLVIRDPIPLVDEMGGSVLFAILAWRFFAKRDKKSAIANKKKLEIKRHVNQASYKEMKFLQQVEEYVYNLNSFDNLDIADALTNVEGSVEPIKFDEEEKEFSTEFVYLLKKKLLSNSKFRNYYNKVVKVRESNIKDEALSSRLIEFGRENKFYLLLLNLLIAIDENKGN